MRVWIICITLIARDKKDLWNALKISANYTEA